jgi:nucleoside-diphosphate-sugar epimerase
MRVKDARQTFLGTWIRNIIEGNAILVYGNGNQIRDYNYVDDVIDALLLVADSDEASGEIYNLGGDPISLKATAELLLKVLGNGRYKCVPFPKDRKTIDIGDYYGHFGKIQTKLGWQPKTSLRVGLKKTLEYYEKFYEYYWDAGADTSIQPSFTDAVR